MVACYTQCVDLHGPIRVKGQDVLVRQCFRVTPVFLMSFLGTFLRPEHHEND